MWQIQEEQKKTAANQELKSSFALETFERENEEIIKEAMKAKPTAFKSKAAQLANINDNKRLAKDEERRDRQRSKFKKGELIQLPTTKKSTRSQSELDDEELALKFPVYHDILSEDD